MNQELNYRITLTGTEGDFRVSLRRNDYGNFDSTTAPVGYLHIYEPKLMAWVRKNDVDHIRCVAGFKGSKKYGYTPTFQGYLISQNDFIKHKEYDRIAFENWTYRAGFSLSVKYLLENRIIRDLRIIQKHLDEKVSYPILELSILHEIKMLTWENIQQVSYISIAISFLNKPEMIIELLREKIREIRPKDKELNNSDEEVLKQIKNLVLGGKIDQPILETHFPEYAKLLKPDASSNSVAA